MTTIYESATVAEGTHTVDLALGTATNLLYGLKPAWTATADALFAPPTPSTRQIPTSIEARDTGWGFPMLTLHDDAQSLLSTLYDYRVDPAFGETGTFSVPVGPLVLADSDTAAATAAAGAYVGLDLTKVESYLLVRLRRSIGTAVHPSIADFGVINRDEYLTNDARKIFEALATGADVTREDLVLDMKLTAVEASTYLQTMYELGTHFVSSVEAGDVIFQVFAYPPDRFAELSAAFRDDSDESGQVTGIDALAYDYYTSPVGTGSADVYGYASQTGTIAAFSGDPLVAATVKAGNWEDERFARGPSIFQAHSPAKSVARFLRQFQKVVSIGIGLAPLADLVAQPFQATALDRLFKGALLQKYGSAVTVPFEALRDIDWHALLPGATASWLSTIATRTIDVYQEVVDLDSVQMINTDVVQSFTVVSMALLVSGSEPIDVPGKNVTIASYVLDTSRSTTIPTLRVTAEAFSAIEISVGEMYGALTIAAADGSARNLLLDGFRFATGAQDGDTKRSTVKLAGDVLAAPDAAMLARIATDLEFSVVSAESLMWQRSTNQDAIRKLTRGYLDWLSSLVPSTCTDVGSVAMAARAQYLSKAALSLGGHGVSVPYLTFDAYKDYVASIVSVADTLSVTVRDYQRKIDAAKEREWTARTAAEINANIKATGKLLTEYFDVLARNQRDVADCYGSIAEQRIEEFTEGVTDIVRLQAALRKQQDVVNETVRDFQKALVRWEDEEILKLVFQVASDVFAIGVAIAVPATEIDAVKSLCQTAQKIQKFLSVIDALSKTWSDLGTTLGSLADAEKALKQLDKPMVLPTALEWQEFSINMNASLAGVPSELASENAGLVAAFDILALRGQALLNAQARQAQLLADRCFNERQRDINTKQATRLAELKSALKLGATSAPDLPKIDLIGLTGQTQTQLKQVLTVLARTLLLQDGAVQYTYLGSPTPIHSFDLTSLRQVMLSQQASIASALVALNPPPLRVGKPIEYRVAGVSTSAVTDGGVFGFTIQPSATEFLKYAMVRIDKVVLRIDGITGSTGGGYLAELSFVGNPFQDRDRRRAPIEFSTAERRFGPYLHDIASKTVEFGDKKGKTEAKITKVTPFGNWNVSLPPTDTNEGLEFAGLTVDIVLSFEVTALLVDPPAKRLPAVSTLARAGAAVAAGASPAMTLDLLRATMYTRETVLEGWDAVFNVRADAVNKLMAQQYREKYAGQDMPIDFGFCTGPIAVGDDWIGIYHEFHVLLGGPLLTFELNNSRSVSVRQIIKSGTQRTGTKVVSDDWEPSTGSVDDPGVRWSAAKAIDVGTGPYVQGSVLLGYVQGLVAAKVPGSTTQSVVLEFARGSFLARDIKVASSNTDFNRNLTQWFCDNAITYTVNTVDFSNITSLSALTPSKFMLNVLNTESGGAILQQFITTNGTQRSNLTTLINEPIPKSYECSLMINTRIVFGAIVVEGFNRGSSNIRVSSVSRGDGVVEAAWSARVSSGSVSSPIKFPSSSNEYRISANCEDVVWDLSGLEFLRWEGSSKGEDLPAASSALALAYEVTRKVGFQMRFYINAGGIAGWGEWRDYSVDVNVKLSGTYPIKIENSGEQVGKHQMIRLVSDKPAVDVSNTSIKPAGRCECKDDDLRIAVLKQLQSDVPAALQGGMADISFAPVSLFALESLLFPGGALITMDHAFVPGDLLIVGHFDHPPTG